jgi:pilus assembly protein CpaC
MKYRGHGSNRGRQVAAFLALLLCGFAAFGAWRVLASQIITLTLNAGEAYVIKNVDSGTTPTVNFTDNSNAFTVKSSGPHTLTVFSFQKGEGSVDTKVAGEDVTYHVIVRGVVNATRPLRPGTAPPAISAGAAKVAPPAPYAPASAAVPAGSASAGASPPAEAMVPASAGLPAEKEAGGPVSSPPDSGVGPVVTAPAPEGGYSGAETGSTKTEIVGPTAFGTGTEYAPGAEPSLPGEGSATAAQNPNVGRNVAGEWHAQQPSVVSQQFSTNPRATRPQGYVTSRAFGGHHNLPADAISITSGTSQVYDFGGPISRVSIANTAVADVQVMGTHQLMLIGHQPGFTSLVVWDAQGNYLEREIWTEVAGHQQVMIHVIVAEVSLSALQQQGIDISIALKKVGLTFVSLPGLVASPFTAGSSGGGTTTPPIGGTPLPLQFSQNMTYLIAGNNSNVAAWSFFQFLESHDLGRILARPQLLANSGQKATFLSGGEIPIVITQALTSTIVFKKYGTSVDFIPTVIGDRDIDLQVRPEVSQPDYTLGVQLFGFTVPAFVTRRARTHVRLRSNQTLIIAGLILDQDRSTIEKVPYLGDVPYLGTLFRHTYWRHDKTELVMSVTPQIVSPLPPGAEVAVPTERQGPFTPEQIRTKPLTRPDVARPRF